MTIVTLFKDSITSTIEKKILTIFYLNHRLPSRHQAACLLSGVLEALQQTNESSPSTSSSSSPSSCCINHHFPPPLSCASSSSSSKTRQTCIMSGITTSLSASDISLATEKNIGDDASHHCHQDQSHLRAA